MKTISEERKEQKRGRGEGANYVPWIWTRELNSTGTTSNLVDWKHGRTIQLLSDGEKILYYILRWNDAVLDIREQFPLDLDATKEIARECGFKHPNNGRTHMTTDMLVTMADNKYRAYSLKTARSEIDPELNYTEKDKKYAARTAQKLMIEKVYWQKRQIEWVLIFKEDLNLNYADNIRRVVEYYDVNNVHDKISMIKHLIATKQITLDMKSALLNYRELADRYIGESEYGQYQLLHWGYSNHPEQEKSHLIH